VWRILPRSRISVYRQTCLYFQDSAISSIGRPANTGVFFLGGRRPGKLAEREKRRKKSASDFFELFCFFRLNHSGTRSGGILPSPGPEGWAARMRRRRKKWIEPPANPCRGRVKPLGFSPYEHHLGLPYLLRADNSRRCRPTMMKINRQLPPPLSDPRWQSGRTMRCQR